MVYIFTLLLLNIFPRQDCPAITSDDIRRMFALESLYHSAVADTTGPVSLSTSGEPIPGRFVIGFEPGAELNIVKKLHLTGIEIKLIDTSARFLVIETPTTLSLTNVEQQLAEISGIRFVEPDYPARTFFIPNDPMFLSTQWDKWVMYADQAWDIIKGGTIKVAVVDNGVDYTHYDLARNFQTNELGYDYVGQDNDPKPDNPNLPNAFHGTHVAGIIGAVTDNLIGVAGWAQVQLLAVRVLNDSGNGNLTDVALGIRWAVDHGARVINLSLGGDATTTPLNEACNYALSRGAILIAAAGNDGRANVSYPARLSTCVCVGATDELSELASFSNYGPEQEVVAPGVTITSTAPDNSYLIANGTSMSCPEVSGVAALILSLNPALTPNEVRAILAASAIDMGSPGKDNLFGYGMVNAARALQLTQVYTGSKPINVSPAGFQHRNAPDPISGNTIFTRTELTLPEGVRTVELYDPAGKKVYRFDQRQSKITLPGSGIYFLILHPENQTPYSVKLIIPR
ncbi:S8 family serine peptidase [candidate division WOR-3 bacterium]|nr:S8 family serine peptidase [candidate division WOR-3 bacterium]